MKVIFLILFLIPSLSFADPYDDYWEKLRKMKYEDSVVEVDGKKYIENSLYQEGSSLYEEEKKENEIKEEVEYMNEGSLVPKNYKGLFDE